MDRHQYSDHQFTQLNKYIFDVQTGKILTNRYVRQAVDRYVKDRKREDLVWDKKKVEKVLQFFSLLRANTKNVYTQFQLMPFQIFIIANLYGFYWKHNGKRRFRYSYLEMARKSGKTMFSVALSLYHLVADGVQDGQVLFLATTREQATIALRYSKALVANSPAIQKRVKVLQYALRFSKKIDNNTSVSELKTLASNADRLDGYSPSFVLLDEFHSHPTDDVYKVMKSGVLARESPLINIITTAGFDLSKPCYAHRTSAINLLRGTVESDDMFTMIFTLDEGDDFTDSSLWIKANPALGHISNLEDLESEYNQAKITPSLLNNFLTKHLNLWIANEQGWIDEDVLEKAFKNNIKIEDFKGEKCYMGMDLSSTRDLTSIVLLFEREGKFYAFTYFFMADNPSKKIRQGGIDLGTWVRQGHIIECQTKTIDYELMYDYLRGWSEKFDVLSIGYDPFNSALIIPQIEALGIECVKVPQTPMAFNFPLKHLEKLMYDDKIKLSNPALKWNFRNVVMYVDGNGNQKIMKNKSLDSVDGCVSLAEAMSMWIQVNLSPERMAYEAYIDK